MITKLRMQSECNEMWCYIELKLILLTVSAVCLYAVSFVLLNFGIF